MLVRNKALWIPILLTLGTAALYATVRPESRPGELISTLTLFAKEYFLVPPAIGGAFITGFMAPRASWLLGIMVGLVAAATYSVLVLNGLVVFPTTTAPPRPGGCRLRRVRDLAGHRRVLRVDCRVVPAVPVPDQPEPRSRSLGRPFATGRA